VVGGPACKIAESARETDEVVGGPACKIADSALCKFITDVFLLAVLIGIM